jgi:hypothetical protein
VINYFVCFLTKCKNSASVVSAKHKPLGKDI